MKLIFAAAIGVALFVFPAISSASPTLPSVVAGNSCEDGNPLTADRLTAVAGCLFINITAPETALYAARAAMSPVSNQTGIVGEDIAVSYPFGSPSEQLFLDLNPVSPVGTEIEFYFGSKTVEVMLDAANNVISATLLGTLGIDSVGDYQIAAMIYDPSNANAIVSNFTLSLSNPSIVPLPAALPLLAGGLGILGFMGWRRNRSA